MHRSCLACGVLVVLTTVVLHAEEKVLYDKTSAYNRILVTEDAQGLRALRFNDSTAVQSMCKVGDLEHLELPYIRAMNAGLAFVEKPHNALFIGLGGGTLPSFIHHHYPHMEMDAVELDPAVVEVAKDLFAFRPDEKLRIHAQDGRRFIEECGRTYDIIFLDAYGADSIPYSLATREFLTAVRKVLNPKGVVVANLMGPRKNPLYDSMQRTYQNAFEELYILDIRQTGSQVFLAFPVQRNLRGVDMARQVRALSREKQFRFDLSEFVLQGFRCPERNSGRGRILLDKDKPSKSERDD